MSIQINSPEVKVFNSGDELPLDDKYLWSLVSGVVKSCTLSESGTAITLGFWGTDDVLGKSLSQIEPYSLKCINEVKAIAVAPEQYPDLACQMFYQAQQIQQLIYIVRNNRVHQRLLLLLQWLADKFGRTIDCGRLIDFKLTHQELADTINSTRITVTKNLNQLEQDGLIFRPRSRCIILRA